MRLSNLVSRFQRLGWVCLGAAVLSACAPTTRVILLPEPGGKPSAVEVRTPSGAVTLAQPYQAAEVGSKGDVQRVNISPLMVMDRYGKLLSHNVVQPIAFTLHFETGSSVLTADSQALLPRIIEQAKKRVGGEIIIEGHTDRVGALQANDELSLQRARAIKDLLVAQGFSAELIDAIGRGERAPLVATEDETAEPRNRRAEVLVR